MKEIPFFPKSKRERKMARVFNFISARLSHLFPFLKAKIIQSELPYTIIEYLSLTIYTAIKSFFLLFLPLLTIILLLNIPLANILPFILGGSFVFSLFMFFECLMYPSLVLIRKKRQLNRDLLFALRHLLIQVRSGVPLYNALLSVGEAGYGQISKEFQRVAKEISGGVPPAEALDNMVMRSPSLYLRRAIWQISNGLRAGADIGGILETIVKEFAEEQRVELQRFARELNPWALMYMMVTVIFPTMGVAMLLVITTFVPITITPTLYIVGIFIFIVLQYFFIKFIKHKRPQLRFGT